MHFTKCDFFIIFLAILIFYRYFAIFCEIYRYHSASLLHHARVIVLLLLSAITIGNYLWKVSRLSLQLQKTPLILRHAIVMVTFISRIAKVPFHGQVPQPVILPLDRVSRLSSTYSLLETFLIYSYNFLYLCFKDFVSLF